MKTCAYHLCDRKPVTKGYCRSCYAKWRRWGDIALAPGRGNPGKPKNLINVADSRVIANGYRRIRILDESGFPSWPLEHRYVMEEKLGRQLLPGENVHHLNGNKLDNRPENLELWVNKQPHGQRIEDALAWAREIINRYG